MPLYARIVDGVLQSVGGLPLSARRMDTGHMVFGDQILARLEACRLYDLDTVNADALTDDPVKRATLKAAIVAARARALRRDQFADNVTTRAGLARETNWDWIDKYCNTQVASTPFVSGQSPNAGQNWGSPTAAEAAAILRLGVSYAMVEGIQFATAIEMLAEAVASLLQAVDIDPPTDR